MSEEVKSFLYAWLGKAKKGAPEYNVRPSGPKHRQRFLCQLAVPGYPYQVMALTFSSVYRS